MEDFRLTLYLFFDAEHIFLNNWGIKDDNMGCGYLVYDREEPISRDKFISFINLLGKDKGKCVLRKYLTNELQLYQDVFIFESNFSGRHLEVKEGTVLHKKLSSNKYDTVELWLVECNNTIDGTNEYTLVSDFDDVIKLCGNEPLEYNKANNTVISMTGESGHYYIARKVGLKNSTKFEMTDFDNVDSFYFVWNFAKRECIGYTYDIEVVKELRRIIKPYSDYDVYKLIRRDDSVSVEDCFRTINFDFNSNFSTKISGNRGNEITMKSLAKWRLLR